MIKCITAGTTLLAALAASGIASAQAPIPKQTISAVTQPLPTSAQFTLVDVPFLREGLPKASNGAITVQLSSHSERNLGGNEIVRLVRSGQVDIGAGTLSTLSGDVPLLDGIDLSGLSPDIGMARKIADAMLPIANKELERFNTRLVVTYPFPAQVLFCRQPFTSLSDLKGRKVRTFGNSLVDLVQTIGGQPVSIGFPEVYSALERGVVDCAVTGTGSGWMPNSYASAVKPGDPTWLNWVNTVYKEAMVGVDFDYFAASYKKWFGIDLPIPKVGFPQEFA